MITITNTNAVADNTIVINGNTFMVTDDIATQILQLCQGKSTKVSNSVTKPVAKKDTDKYLVKHDRKVTWGLDPDGTITFNFGEHVGRKVFKAAANQAKAFEEAAKAKSLKKAADRKAFVKWMNEKHPVITAEAANAVKLVWERG